MDIKKTNFKDKNDNEIYLHDKVHFRGNLYKVVESNEFIEYNPNKYILELCSNTPYVVNQIVLEYYCHECEIAKSYLKKRSK